MEEFRELLGNYSFFKKTKKNTKECEVWICNTNPDFIICHQPKKKHFNKIPFNIERSLLLKDEEYIRISELVSIKEAFSLRLSIVSKMKPGLDFLPEEAFEIIRNFPITYGYFVKAGYSMAGVSSKLESLFVEYFTENFEKFFDEFKNIEIDPSVKIKLLEKNFNSPKIYFKVDTYEKNKFFSPIIKFPNWRYLDYFTDDMFKILEEDRNTSKYFFGKFWSSVMGAMLDSSKSKFSIEEVEEILRQFHNTIKRENVGLNILHVFLYKFPRGKLTNEMVYLLYDTTDKKGFFIKTLIEITGITDVEELLKKKENIFIPKSKNF